MESASLVPSSLAAPTTQSAGLTPSFNSSSLWPDSKVPTITTLASLYRTGTEPAFVSVRPTSADDQWVSSTQTLANSDPEE